jgi:serine/threonine protein kinase
MEHMEHGSLASHLTVPLPEEQVKQITVQLLDGLACLHENGFVHRDLNPDVDQVPPQSYDAISG